MKPISNVSQYNCGKYLVKYFASIPEGKKRRIIYDVYFPKTYIIWKEFLQHSKIYTRTKSADNAALTTDFDFGLTRNFFAPYATLAN